MMKRYEKYKPSGVEWIGEIPEHWGPDRLKWVCRFEYGESLSVMDREEGDFPVYGSNGITGFHSFAISKAPCIIVGRKGSFGKINWSDKECFPIDTTYFIDVSKTDKDLRWLYYVLQNLGLDTISKDTGVPGLNREDAYQNFVPIPSPDEQTAIANYLDEKTAHVDTLIDKKQKLIELLKDERTAIINNAVTKGINPKAKLKPSGIEWLGDIPEHWEMKKLKYVAEINSTSLTEKENDDLEIEYIDISLVNENGVIIQPASYAYSDAPSRARRIIRKGDTIISTVRTYLKAIAFIDIEKDNLICSTGFAVIRPSEKLEPKFLFYLSRAEKMVDRIMAMSKGVSYPAIDSDDIRNLEGWFPNKEEQRAIVQHIETHTTRIDVTISKIEKEIELLQEYRSALISEVVTGKIKVI